MFEIQRVTPFLLSRDLARTVDFYMRHLDFQVDLLHPSEAPTFCILSNGPVTLRFATDLWPGEPVLTGAIHFEIRGVMCMYERLKPHAPILWGPEVYAYRCREFSCSDPDGYALIFSEETDDPPTCLD